MKSWLLFLALSPVLLFSCKKPSPDQTPETPWFLNYPSHFPSPEFPSDNQPTAERIELGRKLFYDPVLSLDSSISCGTCHLQNFAFANSDITTPGVFGRAGTRNVPGLFNLVYQPFFLREASLPTLEMQILVPIQEHNEFNSNIVDIAEKLKQIHWYDSMSRLAYDREPDAFVITRAIAAFERTLVSANSKYDQVQTGQASFNSLEAEGYQLFTQTLNCGSCHPEPFFTNFEPINNGLYSWYPDPGRYRVTQNASDSGKFKVPSLRNIEFTAPYMFDGSFPDLRSVINHYDQGGSGGPYQDKRIKALQLNDHQKDALIAFLKTLSDNDFLSNVNYQKHP